MNDDRKPLSEIAEILGAELVRALNGALLFRIEDRRLDDFIISVPVKYEFSFLKIVGNPQTYRPQLYTLLPDGDEWSLQYGASKFTVHIAQDISRVPMHRFDDDHILVCAMAPLGDGIYKSVSIELGKGNSDE